MSYPILMVPAGDVIPILFATYAGSTGASVTMTGLAVTDIEIYKDGSVTQRASDAGYTLLDTDGIDFDGLTGIHGFSIDTGDNTDAGFYTVGSWFTVVVSAITVDGQTVSFIAAMFRLMAAEGVAGVPDVNTTHISDTAQTANDVGADVDAILVDTSTTLQAELDGIQADTEDIQTRLPAALVGGRIDANASAISGDTTAADRLEALMDGIIPGIVGASSTVTSVANCTGFTEATNDHFNGRLITFLTGNLAGQQCQITDYTGSTQSFTVTPLTEAPASSDTFVIH